MIQAMRYFSAALVFALMVYVLGVSHLGTGGKVFLSVVALWLMRRMTQKIF